MRLLLILGLMVISLHASPSINKKHTLKHNLKNLPIEFYVKPIKDPKELKRLDDIVKQHHLNLKMAKAKAKKAKTKKIKIAKIAKKDKVIKTAKGFLGKKYVYGANSKRAVDCSSFVQQVYKKHKKNLPRTSRQQASSGKHVDKKDLRKGDLVFFRSKKTKNIAHVGIYLGGGNFIHASSAKKKVVITKLNSNYYRRYYKGARRI